MSRAQANGSLRDLVDLFARRLGFHAEAGDRDRLAQAISERMLDTGLRKADDYRARLASPEVAVAELRAVADALIIGETYFFRGRDHLEVLRQAILDGPVDKTWRVMSAGCSSGEEPYSLLMMADQIGCVERLKVDAFDVNPRALERAAAGRYSAWSLRDTSATLRQRYFRPEGRLFVLDEAIRRRVRFDECNLLDPAHRVWQAAATC